MAELATVQSKDHGVLFPYDNFLLWLATGELGPLDSLIWVVPLYDVSSPVQIFPASSLMLPVTPAVQPDPPRCIFACIVMFLRTAVATHGCVQIHKMYAGMLDVYHYNGNQQALDVVINMTDVWLIPYVSMPPNVLLGFQTSMVLQWTCRPESHGFCIDCAV